MLGGETYVVAVKDYEIAHRLYPIIKKISNYCENYDYFSLYKYNIRFVKYEANHKKEIIKNFQVRLNKEIEVYSYEEGKRVLAKEVGYFLEQADDYLNLKVNGLLYQNKRYNNFSEILSLLTENRNNSSVDERYKMICAIIHSILVDNETYEDYYNRIGKINQIHLSDMPYDEKVMEMMYSFHANLYDKLYESPYIFLNPDKKSKGEPIGYAKKILVLDQHKFYRECENKDLYTAVNEGKIFRGEHKSIDLISSLNMDYIDEIYYNFNKYVVGLKFNSSINNLKSIKDFMPSTQNEIFELTKKLFAFFKNFRFETREKKHDHNSLVVMINKSAEFINSLLISPEESDEDFLVRDIKGLYKLLDKNINIIFYAVMQVLFEKLKLLVDNKYDDITLEKLYELDEVKYLTPRLAKAFETFYFTNVLDIRDIAKAYDDMLSDFDVVGGVRHYLRVKDHEGFPCTFTNVFDNAVITRDNTENYYKIKPETTIVALRKGMSETTFIENVKKNYEALRVPLLDKSDKRIAKIVCPQSMIYDDNCKFLGYVLNSSLYFVLTKEYLNTLDNKQILGIAKSLTEFYERYGINLDVRKVGIDSNGTLVVDIGQNSIVHSSNMKPNYLAIISHLADVEYYDPSLINSPEIKISDYTNMINSLTHKCDKHGMYYDPKKGNKCYICNAVSENVSEFLSKENKVIFEDNYANHFAYDEKYNLKVYKNEIDATLKANIDLWIKDSYKASFSFAQKLFVPKKKAIIENKLGQEEIVGILYEKVDFKEIVDIKSNALNNLAKYKLVTHILNRADSLREMNYIYDSLDGLVISKSIKAEVQILNLEFCSKKLGKPIEKVVCDYVYHYLKDYKVIEEKILYFKTTQEYREWIEDTNKTHTRVCKTHNFLYHANSISCPRCITPEMHTKIANFQELIDSKKYITKKHKVYNEGGEAFIYQSLENENELIKIFKPEIDVTNKLKVIVNVMLRKNKIPDSNTCSYVLPNKLLLDKDTRKFIGYTMNKIDGYQLSILKDKTDLLKYSISREETLKILINVGKGIETLHKNANIYIGDLNGRNILFDDDCKVYFLDFDGMGIDDIKPEFCTDGYIDPKSKEANNITMKDDWYSFAIQAFHYLTLVHPFNGILKENGRNIDLIEKMERRLSLLGSHGIKVPAIAKDFNDLNENLINKFLDIFENEERSSIVPELEEELVEYTKNIVVKRLSDTLFINNNEGVFELIGTDLRGEIVSERLDYSVDKNTIAKSFLNDEYIVIIHNNHLNIYIFDKVDATIYQIPCYIPNVKEFTIVPGFLYYTNDNSNYIRIFNIDERKEERPINFKPDMPTVKYFVESENKLVIIKEGLVNYELYCNDILFHEFSKAEFSGEFNIVFDRKAKQYVIIAEYLKSSIKDENVRVKAEFIIFDNAQNKRQGTLNLDVNVSLDNATLINDKIYILNDHRLDVIDIFSQTNSLKTKMTDKIMSDSKLIRKGKAFYIITGKNLYDYT